MQLFAQCKVDLLFWHYCALDIRQGTHGVNQSKVSISAAICRCFFEKRRQVCDKHHCFHFDLHVITKNNKENFGDFRSCSLLYTAVLCMLCYLNQSLGYTIYSSHEYGMSYALVTLLNTGCTKCC